jgi:hypothetical protein
LCKKAEFLEWKKWQPKRVSLSDLSSDAECNICLEKFKGTKDLEEGAEDEDETPNGGTLMSNSTIETEGRDILPEEGIIRKHS